MLIITNSNTRYPVKTYNGIAAYRIYVYLEPLNEVTGYPLYGLSINRINVYYGLPISHTTAYRVIQTYDHRISRYTAPPLNGISDQWLFGLPTHPASGTPVHRITRYPAHPYYGIYGMTL